VRPSTEAPARRTGYSASMDAPRGDVASTMARRRILDWLVAVGPVVALMLLTFAIEDRRLPRAAIATLLVVVLPLLARRRWPIPVLVIVAFGATVTSTSTDTP